MESLLKKTLAILLIFINTGLCAYSESIKFELGNDYLISSEERVNTIVVKNPEVLTITPFFTIFNEKNTMLLHPIKTGKTNFIIFKDREDITFEAIVLPNSKTDNFVNFEKNGFEFTMLDQPPAFEEFEIDTPPKKEAK